MTIHRNLKKWTSLLLSGAVLAGVAAGCAKTDQAQTSAVNPEAGQKAANNAAPYEFTYMRPVWGPATYVKGGPYEQQLFKEANVKINPQIIPVGEYNTKINVVLASGQIPDVIWGQPPYDSVSKQAQEQGAFLKINTYLDKYPAVKNAVPNTIWNDLKDKNGDIYFIPNMISPTVPFFLFYRQDWFEKLSIPEPKTIDELLAALNKIKNSDLGKQGVYPLGLYSWASAKDLGTSFGIAQSGWMPDKQDAQKLLPWYAQNDQIDFLFWLQGLVKNGLMDPDFKFHNGSTQTEDKFVAGKIAVMPLNWTSYPNILQRLTKNDPNAKIGIMSPLQGPNGIQGGTKGLIPIDRGFYVSAKIKDPERFFQFLNWTLTDGSNLMQYGIEGKTYTVQNGAKIPIPDAQRSNDYKQFQIEPLQFISPMDTKLDWNQIKATAIGAGLGDAGFNLMKSKFDEYNKNIYQDYRNPFMVSGIENSKSTQLFNDYLLGPVEGAIISPKITKQDWQAAIQKWYSAGGQAMVDDVNRVQTDKSKPDYLK
ncbi:extracellular solute-binding protein [Paenibacillus filicis]|uniref:Extracellular solute-binding protein n=1 Tax=Paenibacillus gyeongsangnamensis TaxID=3388067 RepID=A0ABT4Q456_9BACL|nr:extracellular solute-binding protein [Paenibacillus filicis]MCZ8511653.1 extracellular solute-binding protein [Paenibacillus filicis]